MIFFFTGRPRRSSLESGMSVTISMWSTAGFAASVRMLRRNSRSSLLSAMNVRLDGTLLYTYYSALFLPAGRSEPNHANQSGSNDSRGQHLEPEGLEAL